MAAQSVYVIHIKNQGLFSQKKNTMSTTTILP